MSDLQLSLLGLGVVGIIVVWTYNKVQERKHRKAAEKIFRGEQADVLLDQPASPRDQEVSFSEALEEGEAAANLNGSGSTSSTEAHHVPRHEPTFSAPVDERREPTFGNAQAEMTEPSFAPAVEPVLHAESARREAPAVSAAVSLTPPTDWCDSNTDALARLVFSLPIAASDLWQVQANVQAGQRLKLRWFVQEEGQPWQVLGPNSERLVATCQVAMQLVDRRGPVSALELEALRENLQAISTSFAGTLQFPDIQNLAGQSKALDEFCAQLDLQLAVHVIDAGHGAFPGTKLRGVAEAAGMRLTDAGEFIALDEQDRALFAMANMGGEGFSTETLRNIQTHGLTFVLDVPHVVEGIYAFERMLAVARQFSAALGGTLVNAQRAPLSEAMVDAIRKKIVEIHEQMMLAGLPAGGSRAQRLFS